MQLHRLELAAFGPFADVEHIDFAALAGSGVFLLEGPTGAGKSTIIDAIVFALYGSLAAEGSSDDRLHSQHAAPGTEPYVDLVFETAAGVHRIRRTPAFERPKRSGTGTTRQNASATLWRLASPDDVVGEPFSGRAQEIGAEIVRIIGLTREQFVQTVVLPQGQFARFLTAPGEDRRKLLQSLFGTEIYDRTAAVLAERRRDAAAAVLAADAAVQGAVDRFEQAAGQSLADESSPAGGATSPAPADAFDLRRADAVLESCAASARDAAIARESAQGAASTARGLFDLARRRTDALARRAELVVQSRALAEERPTVDAARARLALAERASRVLGVIGGLDAARGRLRQHRAAVAGLVDRVPLGRVPRAAGVVAGSVESLAGAGSDGLGADGPAADAGSIRLHVRALRDAVVAARRAVELDRELPERLERVDRARTTIATITAGIVADQSSLERRPEERAEIATRLEAARDIAADRPAAERAVADARAHRALFDARDRSAERLAEARVARSTAASAASGALAAESAIRARRIAGLAGELGTALVDADPCPVCGSLEHPTPAEPSDDHPTPEAVEAAERARAAADAALAEASTAFGIAEQELLRHDADIAGGTVHAAEQALDTAEERLASAVRAAATLATESESLRRFDEQTEQLERRIFAAEKDQTERQTTLDAEVRSIEEARGAIVIARSALVDAGVPDAGSIADMVHGAEAEASALAELVTALELVDASAADVASREDEAARALRDESFPDADAAQAGRLDVADAAPLRHRVAEHDRLEAVVTTGLAAPEIVEVADTTEAEVDLAGASAAAEAAEAAFELAAAAAATSAERAAQVQACHDALAEALRHRDALSESVRAVVRLADLANAANGVNPTGITLGTYVLMRRFEDVVAAANSRLRSLLAGRLALEVSDERESGSRSRKTGLALAIRDHETDRTRDPRSLSGGETFTVSLCLALGLADIVQAESGGVRLGTLFVDEGFGTLDPETLDDVIGQLSALTAGGRQVGIVSHVEELKQRIPDRVEVRRKPAGGSTLRTTAAA